MDKVYYVANAATPIRWKALKDDSIGLIEHVTPEVLVSWVLLRMMGRKPGDMFNIALAHTLSIPFIGGLGTWLEGHAKMNGTYKEQFKSGAAGVPGLALGYYAAGVFQGQPIFRMPFKTAFWDMVLIAVSKIITRPLVTSADKLLAKDNAIRQAYDHMQDRFDIQMYDSNLNYKKN